MFGDTFFGSAFFGDRYFGDDTSTGSITPAASVRRKKMRGFFFYTLALLINDYAFFG